MLQFEVFCFCYYLQRSCFRECRAGGKWLSQWGVKWCCLLQHSREVLGVAQNWNSIIFAADR